MLFGLPLGLAPFTSYSIHFFTQSLSSFHSTCPYYCNLFCCSTEIISSNPSLSLSLNTLLGTRFQLLLQYYTHAHEGHHIKHTIRLHAITINNLHVEDIAWSHSSESIILLFPKYFISWQDTQARGPYTVNSFEYFQFLQAWFSYSSNQQRQATENKHLQGMGRTVMRLRTHLTLVVVAAARIGSMATVSSCVFVTASVAEVELSASTASATVLAAPVYAQGAPKNWGLYLKE